MNPARSAFPYNHSLGVFALTALLAVTAVSSTHAATVLVDDQFNDGDLINGTDPLDVAWTRVGGTGSNLAVTANALTQSSSSYFVVKGVFTPVTLTNGGSNDSITLTMDIRATSIPGASDAGFRFGLGTSGTGANTYVFHLGTGGTAPGGFVQWAGVDSVSGTPTVYATSPTPGTAQSITDTAYHTFSLTITRTSATSLSFSSSIDGFNYTSVSSNSISNFNFDRIILGEGGTSVPFAIDNVLVTQGAIPEPSTYAALAGLAALGLVAFKRTRNVR